MHLCKLNSVELEFEGYGPSQGGEDLDRNGKKPNTEEAQYMKVYVHTTFEDF